MSHRPLGRTVLLLPQSCPDGARQHVRGDRAVMSPYPAAVNAVRASITTAARRGARCPGLLPGRHLPAAASTVTRAG